MQERSNIPLRQIEDCNSFVEILIARATLDAKNIAFTFLVDGENSTETITYAELDRRSRAIAALLQAHKAYQERAILVYQPGLDYIAAFLGCLYAGVVAVPAYPPRVNRSLARIQSIASDAQAAFLLATASTLSNIDSRNDQLPDLQRCCRLSTDNLPVGIESQWDMPDVTSDTLAFLQYTSGSTSAPKGVMVSHGNLLANERMICHSFEHDSGTIGVNWLPIYHDMGLIGHVLQPLYVGFNIVHMSPLAFLQQPVRWLRAISRFRAFASGGPNFAYDLCAAKITPEQRATLDLSCWKTAFTGSEPIRAETLNRFSQTFAECGFDPQSFHPCYGLAEATLFVTGAQKRHLPTIKLAKTIALERHEVCLTSTTSSPDVVTEKAVRPLVGSGRPWLDQRIRIVDPETRVPCPQNRIGEVWVAGPNVAQGYWAKKRATSDTFHAYLASTSERHAGPFMRTGDLGFMHEGELFITGRLKDMLIVEGRNHYPQDIELTVEHCHPAIRQGCVAAFSVDQEGREQLVVVAEIDRQFRPRPQFETAHSATVSSATVETVYETKLVGAKSDLDAIRKAVRQAVTQHHDLPPASVALLRTGQIFKTSSGKIQRHACRQAYLDGNLPVWAD